MSKTALVVDDSQVARHVLTGLLSANGIAADSAESAEVALDYLKHQRPDVIFMDHMMPGMDGFQALEAIKANPTTATIPVMMYTSQEGELYVGQARALGAFGVLPKNLKPIEVTRVLKALHLIPGDRAGDREGRASQPQAANGADSRRVAELLEELFHQQRSALREEIREGYERAIASTQTQLALSEVTPPEPRKTLRPAVIAAVALGALATVFGYLYFSTTELLQETTRRSSDLIASTAQLTDVNIQALGARNGAATGNPRVVEFIEWALNETGTYGFDEIALGESRAENLRRAIEFAAGVGLGGRLSLRVHVGRFCMAFGPNGTVELAAPAVPVTQCEQLGWLPSEAFALGRRQTLGFANIVSAAQSDTRIRVETASAGADEPIAPYPDILDSVSAGEWNRVAALNHRVEIHFAPEPSRAATAR
jgi:CheY-like chemotaxis protein